MKARTLGLTLAILVAMSSCGADPTGVPSPTPAASSTSVEPTDTPTPDAADELVITVRNASGTTVSWQLTCSPPGGTHPDPGTACRVLTERGATALPPVPKDRMCSQVYGGPETATITGTWQGKTVRSRLSRVNGCETSRWNALVGLLPRPGA
jgi:hypothetical protein